MGRVLVLALIACMASCYQSPSLASCKYRCGGANNDACPSGYSCNAGMCVSPGESCDGDGGVIDAPDGTADGPDAPLDGPPACPVPGAFVWHRQMPLLTNGSPRQIVALDGDNNGMMDIAVLDGEDANVGFFSGNGDGTFSARTGSSTGPDAKRLVMGDFDRDNKRDDLAVLQGAPTNLVAVMASNNDGTFSRTEIELANDNPFDLANAGDVDNNTHEDLVVLYKTTTRFQVILQVPTSPFWEMGTVTFTNSAATSLHVGMVNDDTIADAIVTVANPSQFGMHAGMGTNASFAFGATMMWNVNAGPLDAASGRLRSGAMPSVVTANANNVSIRHSNGANSFIGGTNLDAGTSPSAVIVADVGGSALPDIITANSGSGTFSVLVNRDNDSWAAALDTNSDPGSIDVVAADFDGDQRLDVAVANSTAMNIVVFLNKCQ